MRCKYCESTDIVKAKVKKTSMKIAVCRECDCVFELDKNDNPIMEYPPNEIHRIREIQKCFRKWDELTDIIPYTNSSVTA